VSAALAAAFAFFSRRRKLEASACELEEAQVTSETRGDDTMAANGQQGTERQKQTAINTEEEEKEKPMADQGKGEAARLKESLRAVDLVRRFLKDKQVGEQFVAFPALVDKQLEIIKEAIEEAFDSSLSFSWRLGRDIPMEKLFRENPIMKLGGQESMHSLVPLSMARDVGSRGKEVTIASQQRVNGERVTVERTEIIEGVVLTGEYAVAAYLLNGTSAGDSRYRERACGVLDAFHRDKLIKAFTFLMYPVWDDGMKCWGDEDDGLVLGTFSSSGERFIGEYKGVEQSKFQPFVGGALSGSTNGGS